MSDIAPSTPSLEEIAARAHQEVQAQAASQALDGLRVTNAIGAAALAAMAIGNDRVAFLRTCELSWIATEQALATMTDRLVKTFEAGLFPKP